MTPDRSLTALPDNAFLITDLVQFLYSGLISFASCVSLCPHFGACGLMSRFRTILFVLLCCAPLMAQPRFAGPTETLTIRVSEGTHLSFDVSPDGKSIVFDLLGQLWLMPARGGVARPITNAVRDTAEDSDPSFSPDGRSVVFCGERNGRTGLWLLSLASGRPRQLTQLTDPDGYEGDPAWSPDGRTIAFTRVVPQLGGRPGQRSAIFLLDVAAGTTRELSITGLAGANLSEPEWVHRGREISFVAQDKQGNSGFCIVPSSGGQASPIGEESLRVRAPSFAPDGDVMAYFAPDSSGRTQMWVQKLKATGSIDGPAVRVTNHADVTPTRIRWLAGASSLLYSADGRMWKVASSGGQPAEVKFTAQLTIVRPRPSFPRARFPEPGREEPARGINGLALSPDGRQIALLALGKLWVMPIDGRPREVVEAGLWAKHLAWSSDSAEVAWSDGNADQADLFAVNVTTGKRRQITSFPGRELYPTYSPDGRQIAFVHSDGDGTLRVVDATATNATLSATRDLGAVGLEWPSSPQWSPESDGLLISADPTSGKATFVPLSGQRQTVTRFPNAPIFLQWPRQNTIVFVRHDRLWRARFARNGMLNEPRPLGSSAALYASASRTGAVLFVSEGGLRLRFNDGREKKLGWPLSYTPPVAESILIRNIRIVDGTGGPMSGPCDILIESGRISRIVPTGTLPTTGSRVIDAAGRIAIPGLMDLHAHTYRPSLLMGFSYYGITTIRDQGSSMAPLVAAADAIAAGVIPGPRVGYGGFQFYSDWGLDAEEWRGIEPEADPDHVKRSVALARAFGAQHIKTRTFRRWDINARMISEARGLGMRATGHCSHQLPLIAAGMAAKEHFGLCEPRGNIHIYDDMVQLFRVARVGVVPTTAYFDFAIRVNERPALLDDDSELKAFLPARENFDWMIKLSAAAHHDWSKDAEHAREATIKLWRAGVTVGTGTDIWQIPNGVHLELEQMVKAGLTPAQAIHAGTGAAARILGAEKDLGTIEVGKWADLILLDADPLADIRNTQKIWRVIQSGRVVDRDAILRAVKSQQDLK